MSSPISTAELVSLMTASLYFVGTIASALLAIWKMADSPSRKSRVVSTVFSATKVLLAGIGGALLLWTDWHWSAFGLFVCAWGLQVFTFMMTRPLSPAGIVMLVANTAIIAALPGIIMVVKLAALIAA